SRFCCGPGSARRAWPGAPGGWRCRGRSATRSGSGARWPMRCGARLGPLGGGGRGWPRRVWVGGRSPAGGWGSWGRWRGGGGRAEGVWLVIDALHELRSAEALRQLELLVTRAPPELRFLLATRQDLRLGLHGLRLEGELTEIRAADLRFTLDEARGLLDAAG